MTTLQGLHILNTRPAAQAGELSMALRQAGATVSELPLMAFLPLRLSDSDRRLLMNLDRYDAVFFVSANAAYYGLNALADFWPQWPHRLPAYVVGEGTAAPLRDAGLTVLLPSRPDSEGLLQMPEWQHPEGKRVLILRGQGGRDLLCNTLTERGAHVDIVELYQRILPPDTITRWQQLPLPHAVILTSPVALQHWQQIAGKAAAQPLWVVVSPRMRQLAEAAGAGVVEAVGADHHRLLRAIEEWRQADKG